MVSKKRKMSSMTQSLSAGSDLTFLAKSLKIRVSSDFNRFIAIRDTVNSFHIRNITFHLLGPTKKREGCKDWYNKKHNKKHIQDSEFELIRFLDKSIPNMASVMILVEKNKKILFTNRTANILKILNMIKKIIKLFFLETKEDFLRLNYKCLYSNNW